MNNFCALHHHFECSEVVSYYSGCNELQAPETNILEEFRSRLSEMRFLDIGVGSGRTTVHFAPLVKEYLGIDYSAPMISNCRDKFKKEMPGVQFKCVDVKDMRGLNDSYFDFVLFSFNGIDYVSHGERLKALQEIRRVINAGGTFCFSTHNLAMDFANYYGFSVYPSVRKSFRQFKRALKYRLKNKAWKSFAEKDYALVCDDYYSFKFYNYYIKPEAQIRQLENAGFSAIRNFSLADGRELTRADAMDNRDPWIYYLCTV